MKPSEMIAALRRYEYVANVLERGLRRGKAFSWGDGQRRTWEPVARELGATLLSKTAIARRGYRIKRGAKPVGAIYYGAPISRYADVYVLECQCVYDPDGGSAT